MAVHGKVIVIGGGVAGLAAACLLAPRGVDVALFEASEKVGGCCGTTTIDGYTFHDGAVYVPVPGLLDCGFARLGLDRAALVPLRKITSMFSVTLPDGTVVTLRDGLDVHVEGRAVDCATVNAELRRMLSKWQPVLDIATERLVTQPYSTWTALRYAWMHLPKFRGTVSSELEQAISDERVRAALAATLLHTGLAPEQMPVTEILALVAILADGLFVPEGGIGTIPGALVAALQRFGGEVRTGFVVRRILVEDGRVRGVRVAGHGAVDAAAVVSTASPMSTFTSLVDPAHVPSSFAQRVERADLSHRAVSVQLGVANHVDAPALMNMVLPLMDRQREVVVQDPRYVTWPVYSVPTMVLPELAPDGGSIIEMFVPVRPESIPKRGKGDRRRYTDSAVAALRRLHDLKVVVTRVRTPADFQQQMRLYEGALYGLSPAVPPSQQFSQDSPIAGLFLAGQCTYPGYGVAPAIMSGIFAADAVVDAGQV